MGRVVSVRTEVYHKIVITAGKLQEATGEKISLTEVVSASVFLAEDTLTKMLLRAQGDHKYKRDLGKALKRADEDEVLRLAREVNRPNEERKF